MSAVYQTQALSYSESDKNTVFLHCYCKNRANTFQISLAMHQTLVSCFVLFFRIDFSDRQKELPCMSQRRKRWYAAVDKCSADWSCRKRFVSVILVFEYLITITRLRRIFKVIVLCQDWQIVFCLLKVFFAAVLHSSDFNCYPSGCCFIVIILTS